MDVKQTRLLRYTIGLSTGERPCRQDCKSSILRKSLSTSSDFNCRQGCLNSILLWATPCLGRLHQNLVYLGV